MPRTFAQALLEHTRGEHVEHDYSCPACVTAANAERERAETAHQEALRERMSRDAEWTASVSETAEFYRTYPRHDAEADPEDYPPC